MTEPTDVGSDRREGPPSIAQELLFAGFLASAIPSFIAHLLRAFWPAGDQMLGAGVAYGVFGIVAINFAERRAKRIEGSVQDEADLTWMMRSHTARVIAATGAVGGGLAIAALRLVPELMMRHGSTPTTAALAAIAACGASLLFAIWLLRKPPQYFYSPTFWRGYYHESPDVLLLSPRQGLRIMFSLTIAFFAPIGACGYTALHHLR